MARILAVEPDAAQAAVLARLIRQIGAESVMADSREAAIAALDSMGPDLILVSALLSPRDESELAGHLRRRESVDHVQMLTIPLLAVDARSEPATPSGGFLGAFRRKRPKPAPPAGCDPERYAEELKGYLKLAVDARAEREALRVREERAGQRLSRANEAGWASEADQVSTDLVRIRDRSLEMPPADIAAETTAEAPIEVDDREPPFVLTPPPPLLDLEAAGPEVGLDVSEHPAHGDMSLSLNFESQVEPEPVPGIEPALDPSLHARADSLPEAFQTPFARVSMPSLEFALGPDVLDNAMDLPASVATPDDDRFSLSISSFEIDRRESDDYLLAAARETLAPAPARTPPPGDGEIDPTPALEIWQALPEWIERCPPLEAHVDTGSIRNHAAPVQRVETIATPPAAPPVDAGWIATALDALRSDIRQLRTETSEARAPSPPDPPAPDQERPPAALPAPAVVVSPQPLPAAEAAAQAVAKVPGTEERPAGKKKTKKARPVEDEWGMFDPSRAGVEALVAALEAKEEREEADEEDEAESPPASTPDPAIPPPRLAPLSRWAFAGETSTAPGVPRPHQRDDLRDLLDGLAVPANVVSVSYPTGCLIRRVRMVREPGAKRKKGQQGEPVIIVSRRALGHGVSGKDDSGPTLP